MYLVEVRKEKPSKNPIKDIDVVKKITKTAFLQYQKESEFSALILVGVKRWNEVKKICKVFEKKHSWHVVTIVFKSLEGETTRIP